LQIVPTPTGLVQKPNGDLDLARVAPQPCELPTPKQCLQFISGAWPTSTPITLFFSGAVAQTTLTTGILLFEVPTMGAPIPVPFTVSDPMPRPAPNAACQTGSNGSTPPMTFMASDVPAGVQYIVQPTTPIKPGTRYAMLLVSGAMSGLRADKTMAKVEPSALFSLMNVDPGANSVNAPVQSSGYITSALLRSQVKQQILTASFAGKTESQLTDDERTMFTQAVAAAGTTLYQLYQFFNATITPFVASGTLGRSDIVWANTWTTGGSDPTVIDFTPDPNPNKAKVPFPNDQLLTVTATTPSGLRVNLPTSTSAPATVQALTAGLNTLDGFSTDAPIQLTSNRDIDPLSIDPTATTPCTEDDCNIVMYPLDASGAMIMGAAVPLIIQTSTGTSLRPPTIDIIPAIPLLQNHHYVLAVKPGLKDMRAPAQEVQPAQVFNFLKLPQPFVDMMGKVLTASVTPGGGTFEQALECSFYQQRGTLGMANEVQGLATELEQKVAHQRFLQAFSAIESGSTGITRTDLLMTFTYTTQSITSDLDTIKGGLLDASPSPWELQLPHNPDGSPMRMTMTATVVVHGSNAIARLIGVAELLCVPICEQGGITGVPPTMCTDAMGHAVPAVENSSLCQLAKTIVAGRLDTARLYVLNTYQAQSGGPFQTMPGKAGTFTPEKIMQPQITPIGLWVITGTGTPAATGYPIAIFQHGLGRQKEDAFLIANTLAGQTSATDGAGWAVVAIDLPFHGARASDVFNNMTGQPCDVDPHEIDCARGRCVLHGTMTAPCDGKQDSSGSGFLGVNLFATRDNFRQATIDQLTLIRALQKEARPGGALPFLDATRIGYIGQSLGSITGANLAAYVSPTEVQHMAFNVGGGGLVNNILTRTVPEIAAPLFAGLAQTGSCTLKDPMNPTLGCLDTPGFRQFLIIGQWVLDPGDPLANSIGVKNDLPGRMPLGSDRILFQMSKPDLVVSNQSTDALTRALYPMPNGSNGAGDNLQIYDFTKTTASTRGTGCHGFLLGPLCGQCDHPDLSSNLFDALCHSLGAQQQAAKFVATGMIGPAVPHDVEGQPCAPILGMCP
jgi:hypothetical protein